VRVYISVQLVYMLILGEGLEDEDDDYEDEEDGDDDDVDEEDEDEEVSTAIAPSGGKQSDDPNECKQQ